MSFNKYNDPSKNNFFPQNSSVKGSTYLDFIKSKKVHRMSEKTYPLFLTADEKMKRIQEIIRQVSHTNVPVLITGESGVGKKFIANKIHNYSSSTSKNDFIVVNCEGKSSSELDADIFGNQVNYSHQKESKQGKFFQANQGTLVLNEVTELSLSNQSKIIKFLQDKELGRMKNEDGSPVKTRLIAITTKDIIDAVKKGKFRQDLYYRLYVLNIEVPSLRDRPKDIPLLTNYFLDENSSILGRKIGISDNALNKLLNHKWYGNVGELKDTIRKSSTITDTGLIEENDIKLNQLINSSEKQWIRYLPIGETLKLLETQFILETLKSHKGNRTHTAKTLGISLRTLRNKINEFNSIGLEVIPPFCNK
ncbi:MAG: hypothetical protein CMP11_01320 [Zetaproteobacteria bacterium]|nr:hypothetical protein [Pseudobdellovibrionaceae bacterium]|tara:strand:+ start:573 stop:1664 length:1092 start_codon:yes stop_codon:yes gene_type:complete